MRALKKRSRLGRAVGAVAFGSTAALLLALAITMAGYGVWLAAAHAALGLVALAGLTRTGPVERASTWSAAALLLAGLITVPTSLGHMNARTDALTAKLEAGGPKALSTADRVGIYGLGLWMGALGLAVYPEAAQEQLGLHFEATGGRREYRSDFAMRSAKFKGPLERFRRSLPARPDHVREMAPVRIAWRGYKRPVADNRVALALNPCTLTARAEPDGDAWRITAAATIDVAYPERSRITLVRLRETTLEVEEGLFWALQEFGWLHPFRAVWTWSVRAPGGD